MNKEQGSQFPYPIHRPSRLRDFLAHRFGGPFIISPAEVFNTPEALEEARQRWPTLFGDRSAVGLGDLGGCGDWVGDPIWFAKLHIT